MAGSLNDIAYYADVPGNQKVQGSTQLGTREAPQLALDLAKQSPTGQRDD